MNTPQSDSPSMPGECNCGFDHWPLPCRENPPEMSQVDVVGTLKEEIVILKQERDTLQRAAKGMLENYIEMKVITLAMARSDAPSWVGARMTPDDDTHVIAVRKALGL